ncbi:uncharacterized protein LOC6558362 isoform X2 [Drosophila grimshawi]|uniref:GH14651 n=1 Tax=Drosophila grimshawi TaxID=7222 RepID=B4IXR4_DROGR|nr:uncharacterized protein LOC6558362 isoform X2 [Drosophila grimshawi]EDV97526.1 GH14651 [Drosophila grimshawi]
MKPTKGQKSAQCYRISNGNKKLMVTGKGRLSVSHNPIHKRCIQTKLSKRVQRKNSPPETMDECPEDDLSPFHDMEFTANADEPEQDDSQNRVLNSLKSKLRPLFQLFSEDSCSPTKPTGTLEPLQPDKPQIIYKNICLSSSDESSSLHEECNLSSTDIDVRRSRIKSMDAAEVASNCPGLNRFEWSPKSTNILLDLWEKNLRDIRGTRKNSQIHKEMAQEMIDYGPSHREIKHKMDNMSRKYRLEAQKIKSGTATNWRYFKRVQLLLIGTPSVDFEEIIFENTDSTTFFNADTSDESRQFNENNLPKLPQREPTPIEEVTQAEEDEEEQEEEVLEEPGQHIEEMKDHPSPHRVKYKTHVKTEPKVDQMLQIEEEKLLVEKQKLRVMQHISRELASIGKTLVELLRNAKKK